MLMVLVCCKSRRDDMKTDKYCVINQDFSWVVWGIGLDTDSAIVDSEGFIDERQAVDSNGDFYWKTVRERIQDGEFLVCGITDAAYQLIADHGWCPDELAKTRAGGRTLVCTTQEDV